MSDRNPISFSRIIIIITNKIIMLLFVLKDLKIILIIKNLSRF